MIGGYESAVRWNRHYVDMYNKAAQTMADAIVARADDVREWARERGADWSAYYGWCVARERVTQETLYQYAAGHATHAGTLFALWRDIATGGLVKPVTIA
jgi:hypothetical protein